MSISTLTSCNAVVVPIYPPSYSDMRGGVFDEDGTLLESSLLKRHYGVVVKAAKPEAPEIHMDGEFIFGGYLCDHFGHFLLESTQRLWFAKQHPNLTIVWALGTTFRPYQREILNILRIRNNHVFLTKPTKLDTLYVPEAAYMIQTYCSREMVDLMGQWEGNIAPGKCTWISRSALPAARGKICSEGRLEERLAEAGWDIFHPESHSVSEQLDVYSSSEHVAGFSGSAFHTLILIKEYRGRVTIFERGTQNRNYATIAEAKNFNQTIHQTEMERGPEKRSRTSYSVPSFCNILNVLTGPPPTIPYTPPVSETHSSRRINTLVSGLSARFYLEVGVARGDTFLNIDIENKYAVDPRFRFDYRSTESQRRRFFEIASDEYFTYHVKDRKFDIVFLDGLHVFEQTYRDLCNALTVTHDKSVILIDDTMPSDVYSSLTNQKEALRFRKEAGGKGGAWHGDIYKVVFVIHDFLPMLSYLTINTGGNPQTLVWRDARKGFQPKWNSLEEISRLTWFDFKNNISLMNIMPEKQGLECIVERIIRAPRKS